MSLYEKMLNDGYRFVEQFTEYMLIDAEQAEKIKCKKCGTNMVYEGYQIGNVSYRAFAVCHKCNHYEEI